MISKRIATVSLNGSETTGISTVLEDGDGTEGGWSGPVLTNGTFLSGCKVDTCHGSLTLLTAVLPPGGGNNAVTRTLKTQPKPKCAQMYLRPPPAPLSPSKVIPSEKRHLRSPPHPSGAKWKSLTTLLQQNQIKEIRKGLPRVGPSQWDSPWPVCLLLGGRRRLLLSLPFLSPGQTQL